MNESLIKEISKHLEEIYEKYNSQGLLSMYIWGSVLTPDFNIETSDADTIAIVNDTFPVELEDEIQKELESKIKNLSKFGFRIIYKSELDGGEVNSPLVKVGIPQLLLLDFNTWKYICGQKFSQSDFLLPVPTLDEAIKMRIESANLRWPDIDAISQIELQYFIKHIFRIIHLAQLKRMNSAYTLFSYSSMLDNAERGIEMDIIHLCLKLKVSRWNFDIFGKNKTFIKEYLDFVSRSAFDTNSPIA